MSDERENQPGPRITRELLGQMDFEHLMLQPQFKRFLFTVLSNAHILQPAYGTDGRHLPFVEGRRSLGFDILRSAEKYQSNALLLILAEEAKTQQETANARRKSYDRNSELNDSPPGGAADGLVFLEYPPDPTGAGGGSTDEGA